MDKIKTNKNGNDIMWVEYWVKQAHPSMEFEISADPYEDKWECEIEIPVVEKTIRVVSDTEVDAMLNAAKEARKAIEDYESLNPEESVKKDEFWISDWEVVEDEEGHFLEIKKSSASRKAEGLGFERKIGTARRAIESAIAKVSRIFGSAAGLNIQVIDKELLGDNLDLSEIQDKVWNNYRREYKLKKPRPDWASTILTEDSVIAISYQKREKDMKGVN